MSKELDHTALGVRLREARDYVGLTQDDVANAVGLSRSAISQIESGQRGLDAIELTRFATIYRRPVTYFVGDASTPPLPKEIEHLARTASELKPKDRAELRRFAEFLKGRDTEAKR